MLNITLLLFISHYSPFAAVDLKPAIDIAFERVNDAAARGLYAHYVTISYILEELATFCGYPAMTTPGIAARLYAAHSIDALLGPPCSLETIPVSDLAAYWNLPIISGVSTSSDMDDKNRHLTLTRTSYQTKGLMDATLAFIQMFGWQRISLIGESLFGSFVSSYLEGRGETLDEAIHMFPLEKNDYDNIREMLPKVTAVSRSKCRFSHRILTQRHCQPRKSYQTFCIFIKKKQRKTYNRTLMKMFETGPGGHFIKCFVSVFYWQIL